MCSYNNVIVKNEMEFVSNSGARRLSIDNVDGSGIPDKDGGRGVMVALDSSTLLEMLDALYGRLFAEMMSDGSVCFSGNVSDFNCAECSSFRFVDECFFGIASSLIFIGRSSVQVIL